MYISITAFSINMQGYNLYIFQIPKETQNGSSHPPLNLFLINTHTKKKKKVECYYRHLFIVKSTIQSRSYSKQFIIFRNSIISPKQTALKHGHYSHTTEQMNLIN